MMKVRLLNGLAIVSLAAALGGCVSYGNTHALLTPVGVAGYHTFKPANTDMPREIRLPDSPDRIAANHEPSIHSGAHSGEQQPKSNR